MMKNSEIYVCSTYYQILTKETIILNELSTAFPESAELIDMLLESTDGKLTEDLINQLIESTSDQVHIIHIVSADASFRVVFPEKLCSGDILLASETLVDNSSINCSVTKIRFGSCLGLACCRNIPFGYHHWCASFRIDGIDDSTAKVIEAKGQILCSSLLYDFLSSSDDLLEEFVWGWSYGGLFTDALESSLLELLIANNDELEATVRSWKPMMSAFNGMEQETSRLVDMIRSDLSVALTLKNKAGYAIGRLHQNLLQLMDSGNGLLGLPQIFTDACKSFLMLKLTTAPQSVLNDRIKVTLPHVQSFINSTICGDLERTRLKGSLSCMRRFSSDASPVIDYELVTALQGLRPRGIEAMMGGYSIGSSRTPIYMPIIDNNILITSSDERSVALDSIVTIFAECLGQDYMQLGSMMGTKLGTSSLGVSFDATLIQDLLDAGLEYVVAGDGKLLAMMHIHRSVLVLRQLEGTNGSATSTILPISLSKRRKDMSRVFRNKLSPEDKLSLKVNSNFDLALLSLRDHHGDDCWIDAHLENVWRAMFEATPPQLIVFELWYNDELIAADFGHSCAGGKSFYVATRFFSRHNEKHKLLQPGFLLALAETKALKDRGYFLWDLGGVNRCPLMQYKYDLTGESVERPIALQIFRDIRNAPSHNDLYSASVPPFHQNMIISEKLGLDDLLS